MQCEICHGKEACVHVKQIVNGDVSELHACLECAEKQGISVHGTPALGSMLFGAAGTDKAPDPTLPEVSCPECHMRESDFRRTHRLGCPVCYDAFKEQLGPMLREMHRGCAHAGKVPAGEQAIVELRALEEELAVAVKEQRFEDAAALRDRIGELREVTASSV